MMSLVEIMMKDGAEEERPYAWLQYCNYWQELVSSFLLRVHAFTISQSYWAERGGRVVSCNEKIDAQQFVSNKFMNLHLFIPITTEPRSRLVVGVFLVAMVLCYFAICQSSGQQRTGKPRLHNAVHFNIESVDMCVTFQIGFDVKKRGKKGIWGWINWLFRSSLWALEV